MQDGSYEAMRRSILQDRTPNLFLLQYERPGFVVRALVLVPHFAFNVSFLEKRKPLSSTAQRHDWVGCNFLLDRLPSDTKIPVISDGRVIAPEKVRQMYKKVLPLERLSVEKRGWTLDVLNVVRSLGKTEFTLQEVYEHSEELASLHPKNHHVDEKIRQQLQELRKVGVLKFLKPGLYQML